MPLNDVKRQRSYTEAGPNVVVHVSMAEPNEDAEDEEEEDEGGKGFQHVKPYTGRTSFGVNQGDQRHEAAAGLERKARERSGRFLRPSATDAALRDTAKRLRGE